MSRLDRSIASSWSAVSLVGEALLELALPVAVGGERVAGAAAALGVEVEQLAGELLRGVARARLHRLPARAAELRQRRVRAAGADVARDLRELVGGHEDLVVALVLEVEVVARDAGDGLRVEAGEARDAVVLVDDDVAGAQVGERAQRARARRGRVRWRSARRRRNSRWSGITARRSPAATNPSRSVRLGERSDPAAVASPIQLACRRARL